MPFSIVPVAGIDVAYIRKLSGNERFITHAHNPCMASILTRTFGWEGGTFIIRHNGKEVGVLSCMLINGTLVSMPHFSFGGILTAVTERKAMYSGVIPLVHHHFTGGEKGETSFLIRDRERITDYVNDTKVISWLDLSIGCLEKIIPANQMSKAKNALVSGLNVVSGGKELFPDFYKVYSRNMLRLGSPVLPKKLFLNILDGYTDGDARIFCVYRDKTAVGAAFLMSFLGFFENTWFSTLQQYNKMFPAQLLHVEMIRFALELGGHTYSFGRSTSGSGVHEFKRRWKTEETIFYWNYDKPLKLDLRKAEFLARIWRLFPLPLANCLGPVIGKGIY